MTTINTSSPEIGTAAAKAAKPWRLVLGGRLGRSLTGLLSVALGIVVWEMLSWRFRHNVGSRRCAGMLSR